MTLLSEKMLISGCVSRSFFVSSCRQKIVSLILAFLGFESFYMRRDFLNFLSKKLKKSKKPKKSIGGMGPTMKA